MERRARAGDPSAALELFGLHEALGAYRPQAIDRASEVETPYGPLPFRFNRGPRYPDTDLARVPLLIQAGNIMHGMREHFTIESEDGSALRVSLTLVETPPGSGRFDYATPPLEGSDPARNVHRADREDMDPREVARMLRTFRTRLNAWMSGHPDEVAAARRRVVSDVMYDYARERRELAKRMADLERRIIDGVSEELRIGPL